MFLPKEDFRICIWLRDKKTPNLQHLTQVPPLPFSCISYYFLHNYILFVFIYDPFCAEINIVFE